MSPLEGVLIGAVGLLALGVLVLLVLGVRVLKQLGGGKAAKAASADDHSLWQRPQWWGPPPWNRPGR